MTISMLLRRPGQLAGLALIASGAFAGNQPPKLRLAEVENIAPISYRVDLHLDPEKDDLTGTIDIKANVKEAVSTVWLNQEHLALQSATARAGGKTWTAKIVSGGEDFVGLQFDSPVPAGPAEIEVHYTGAVITKNSTGVFRQQSDGIWYLFSQFEPSDARAAFPCFDEPSYKTPWKLTLHVPAGDSAISNTSVESEKTEGATKTVVFRETLPLPSYLVAFGVGPFEFVDAGRAGKNKVPVRIVVPKGHTGEAKYAAEVTATIISRHEEYFGIPFPYDKADQVAVPDTSGWGAMENPGMVTYAQNIILADPKTDTINRQRGYASTAAHELAHQWFGDLVTTAWWDDIWLNESFATWMEQKLIAEWKPEWHTRVDDVDNKMFAAGRDSLISSRKIRQEIQSKDDINNAFDGAITYAKGAAVIGMFENWMGPKDFQKGVQSYMKQYAFRATTLGDFLDSLSSAGKQDINKPFSTFLNQAGVPVVSVTLDCKNGAPTLHLEQKRSLPLGSKGSADQMWQIPVCVRYGGSGGDESECTLLKDVTADWKLKAKSCPTWVQANDQAKGYYRVDYKGGLLAALSSGDVQHRLSAAERVDLMGNASALTRTGKLPPADALALVETFHADPARQVVDSAVNLALAPRAYLVPESLRPNYRRFLLKNFQARAHELGWVPKPDEPDDVKLLRPSLVNLVATLGGDTELADQAKDLTAKWFEDHQTIDPNLVDAVLGTAAYYGDKALFDRFLGEFKKAKDKQLRGVVIGVLGQFRDRAAIESGMNALVNGEIPFMEGPFLLFNGQGDADTRKLPFEFLKAHFDQVVSKMPSGGGFDFGSVLPQVGGSYCDADSRRELEEYFKPRVDKFTGASRTLDQVLESIDLCIARVEAQKPGVAAFLAKY
jgi:alanyl aminopeptidase